MRKETKQVICFMAIFAILCGSVTLVNMWDEFWPSQNALDFRKMKPDERVVAVGFNNSGLMQVKLSYLEFGERYPIGVFADHTGAMFSKEAFPPRLRKTFFNYFMATTSLPEVRDIVRYAAENDFLPSETVIVMLDNPLVGDGLLNYVRRSYLNHRAFFSLSGLLSNDYKRSLSTIYELAYNVVSLSLDWRAIWLNTLAPARKALVVPNTYCADRSNIQKRGGQGSIWDRFLPETVRYYLSLKNLDESQELHSFLCQKGLPPGFASDGSEVGRIDGKRLARHDWGKENVLQPRHTVSIVRNIESIHRIVSASGRVPIFVVPPVFGEPHGALAEEVFGRALDSLDKDVRIIDHRLRFQERKYYHGDDEHTGVYYYKALVDEMIARGWLTL